MFGYIKPYKPEMRICEYDLYKSIYCGLCKQIGKLYGPFARLSLSYDFVFLSLLKMAMEPDDPSVQKGRCLLNPLKTIPCCQQNDSMRFSAACAMIMLYYKAKDNILDHSFFGRLAFYPALWVAAHAWKKAKNEYPQIDRIIADMMEQQLRLEKEKCASIDQASDPTATALQEIFALLSDNVSQQRVLRRLGYLLGRYVYLCDASSDLLEDLKHHNYNPYIYSLKIENISSESLIAQAREEAKGDLFYTIAQMQNTFSLLSVVRFAPILENILFRGLKATVISLDAKEKTNHDRPV